MLRGGLIFTSCGRCHVENSPFGEFTEQFGGRVADPEIYESDLERNIPGADLLRRGKRLFLSSGCLGCHGYRGKGSPRGPDLTHIGDKGVHGFDFSFLPPGVERSSLAWLREHFLDPGAVSPGTVMPGLGVGREDAEALAAYMLSLKSQTVPARFRAPFRARKGRPAGGKALYELFCLACHGPDLSGSQVPDIRTPSLSNPDFLSVVSDSFLESIIGHGRSNTNMPPWDEKGGGLTKDQISRLISYIRSFEKERADLTSISPGHGDPEMGKALYRGNCATCHGKKGEGGLGTALSSPGFQVMASDLLMKRTVVEGRPETGMPSWKHLPSEEISDILAYVRTWSGPGADVRAVAAYMEKGSKRLGKKLYRSRCADCHGRKGEGSIGPSLNHEAFLSIVSDEYLIHAIREGRPGTAMPSWRDLSVEDLGDLVTYIRSFVKGKPRLPSAPVEKGDPEHGRLLFHRACASCHGREGAGGLGTQLANPVFLEHASEGFLFETIGRGRPGTPMRGFSKGGNGGPGASGIADFRPGQISDIVAYLKGLRHRPGDPASRRPILGNIARGRHVYDKVGGCLGCHGELGEGAVGSALGNRRFLEQASEGFIIGTALLGRDGTQMRKFGSGGITRLSPEELIDVAAYVRTLPHRKPEGRRGWRTFLVEGPLEEGRRLFSQFCASCHGREGRNGYAPSLNNPEFLAAASDGFLVATIARGRQGTPMRAFGPGTSGLAVLSTDEIRSLVGFIRSWQFQEVSLEDTESENEENHSEQGSR